RAASPRVPAGKVTGTGARSREHAGTERARAPARTRSPGSTGGGRWLSRATEQRERARLDDHIGAGHQPVVVAVPGGQLELPASPESARRQPEADLLEEGVEEKQKRVVAHLIPLGCPRAELVAVQEDADRTRLGVVPVTTGHAAAVGPHPPDIR